MEITYPLNFLYLLQNKDLKSNQTNTPSLDTHKCTVRTLSSHIALLKSTNTWYIMWSCMAQVTEICPVSQRPYFKWNGRL